jgi:hypothetical protein
VGKLWCLVAALGGCGGYAVGSGAPSDGGAGAGGAPSWAGAPVLPGTLAPRGSAPSVEGDGVLPDVPETRVGETPSGWDLCRLTPRWRLHASTPCEGCPAPRRGDDYFIVGPHESEGEEPTPSDSERPMAGFYFQPPVSAAALWLDVAYFQGERAGWLEVVPTSELCRPVAEPQHFELGPMLAGNVGKWASACVPLTVFGAMNGLGFSFDSEVGVFAVDALRFGPACDP